MKYNIVYKNVKHGRVKIEKDSMVQIIIPYHQKTNQKFHNLLIEKAKQLFLNHIHKREHVVFSTHLWDNIVIFGEQYNKNNLPSDLETYLSEKLYQESKQILDEYIQKFWIWYHALAIKKVKTYWGSCSATQNISLNFNLIHLPKRILEYVIVHEMCHLKEKNHSEKFWKLVEIYFPNYKEVRKELKQIKI